MNIKINYGTGVVTLPTVALNFLDRATKIDIKVLFFLCAEPKLLGAENRDISVNRIREQSGLSSGQIEASLAFWRGTGVLDIIDMEESSEYIESELHPVVAGTQCSAQEETSPMVAVSVKTDSPHGTVTVSRTKTKLLDEIPNYTADELEAFLSNQAQASNFLQECQAAWESVFNLRDTNMIVALVDAWGFSWEYVVSLLAYAGKQFKERENQGKTLNYVYRMAMNFHKEGVVTLDALQQKFVEMDRLAEFESRIRKMFGLGERNLTPKEKKYFSTWLYEYKYDIDIIEHAYNITVDVKGGPNIGYTNGVLKHWYEDGLMSLEEIIAKRELETTTIRSIREGKLTPDTALSAVESVLKSEPATSDVSTDTNISHDTNILRRLMNLGNRMLTEGEVSAFTRWRIDYRFRYEIIYYAYQITLENRGEYSLPYVDAILKKWNEQKLTTLDAIKAYEKGYRADKQKKKSPANVPIHNGSFETDDFFMAAVKRSFGDDFDPTILNQ